MSDLQGPSLCTVTRSVGTTCSLNTRPIYDCTIINDTFCRQAAALIDTDCNSKVIPSLHIPLRATNSPTPNLLHNHIYPLNYPRAKLLGSL